MDIISLVRSEIRRALSELPTNQTARVVDVDLEAYKVRVELQSTGVETNWLRVVVPVTGVGAGSGRMPKVDDEVMVIFTDFDQQNGFVIGGLNNNVEAPPNGVHPVDPEAPMAEDTYVVAQWENGGKVVVTNSRDASAPVLLITNNQGDEVKVDQGVITVKTSKDVNVEGDNVKLKGVKNVDIDAANVNITTTAKCTLNSGTQPINNLPACLFSGAPHGTNPKNLG